MDYKTPNVYVEEVSTLPPSVAGVATSIPAFIGYTEKALDKNQSLKNKAVRISSLKEYENYFGYADPCEISVNVNGDKIVITPPSLKYSLYYQMQMFFNNGGSACYIVSVGDYKTQVSKDDFLVGLNELEKEDEPTLILFPDGFLLSDSKDYYDLCVEAMKQCNALKDRFTIIDVINKDNDDIKNFRKDIGINNLKYGAAYYPYLKSSLNFSYTEDSVSVSVSDTGPVWVYEKNNLKVKYKGSKDQTPSVTIIKKSVSDQNKDVFSFSISGFDLLIESPTTKDARQAKNLFVQWAEWNKVTDSNFELINLLETDDWEVLEDKDTKFEIKDDSGTSRLSEFKDVNTGIYNKVKAELAKLKVTLPPGSSMAGVYSGTDRDRGVWKAPANVSLNSVIGPVTKITDADQENLNVDATGGKSVNAIRSFAGKGTLVWGARTLAGNDNEWRYINVRRLFIYMEESLKKATYFAVFEPNTAMTWLKVKTMAESFLDNIWRQGGLAGASADQAYFVHVGLGTTMTTQDILEGRMIVEIGVAAVRPAEFIILRFSHKLQEA